MTHPHRVLGFIALALLGLHGCAEDTPDRPLEEGDLDVETNELVVEPIGTTPVSVLVANHHPSAPITVDLRVLAPNHVAGTVEPSTVELPPNQLTPLDLDITLAIDHDREGSEHDSIQLEFTSPVGDASVELSAVVTVEDLEFTTETGNWSGGTFTLAGSSVGESTTTTLTAHNPTAFRVLVTDLSDSGSNDIRMMSVAFAIPFIINPGDSVDLAFEYQPSSEGADLAILRVEDPWLVRLIELTASTP